MEDLTLVKLREAFSVAQKAFERADARYKEAIAGLYMAYDEQVAHRGMPAEYVRKYRDVTDYIVDERGRIYSYATEYSQEFGTFRNGRFYKRPTAYYKLRDLEHDHAVAEKSRDMFKIVCNRAGIKLEI